jgi:hypothetical protein
MPYYNPELGKIVMEAQPPPQHDVDRAILFEDTPALACLALIDRTGIPINSAFNRVLVHRTLPYVDAITLEAGLRGDAARVATQQGRKYRTDLLLPVGSDYYLGLNSLITLTPADLNQGAKWLVKVARWVNEHEFIFDPQAPLDLLNPSPAATISIADTVTGDPGTDAIVVNLGTPLSVVLKFTIPRGERGPQGQPGDLYSLYRQLAPLDTWNIIHNLGKNPSVTCFDTAGSQVEGDVTHHDLNSLSIFFGSAFAGEAYLN